MSEETTISVNFGRPMPLFPLDTVLLLPQQVQPLHIFEPRYRQMIDRALDGAGQFASAVFKGARWKLEYHGRPPLKPAVCVAQIVQHERLHDGRYNVLVQGVCRARIVSEIPPDEENLYRQAMLEPIGLSPADSPEDDERLSAMRAHVEASLADGPLRRLRVAETLRELAQREHFPTAALLELLTMSVIDDQQIRYQLLAEGDPGARAEILGDEISHLERLIANAERQRHDDLPKGCHWN